MTKMRKLLIPVLAGFIAAGACADLGTEASGDARVSVLLTDAPGDLKAAVVTITDIYLQPSEGEDAQRVYLRQNAPVTTNLLTLSNDVLQLVGDAEVPAGNYRQLRFVISGGYVEIEKAGGGSTIYATSTNYPGLPAGVDVEGVLHCPSCAQSGFKVLLGTGGGDDVELGVGADQTLLVDFDVSKSYGKPAGNSGKWILNPVLKAIPVQSAGSVTVTFSKDAALTLPTIAGAALSLGSFSAALTPVAGGDPKTVKLTDANNDGIFEAKFEHLLPGQYKVGIAGPAGITFATDQAAGVTVTVGSGGSASAAFKLTAAAAA